MSRFGASASIVILAVIAASALGEMGLRWFAPVAFMAPPTRPPAGDSWRGSLHRASELPGLAYELAPDAQAERWGLPLRTNSWGMRDREPPPKREGTRRVLALGDSFTFGFAVAEESAYPAVLGELLAVAASGTSSRLGPWRYEVFNGGVGGYSTRDAVLLLRHRMVHLESDLVVLGYTLNDPETDPLQPLHAHFDRVARWRRSHLLRAAAMAHRSWRIHRLGDGSYTLFLHRDPRRWATVTSSFDSLAALGREREFAVLVVIWPNVPDREWRAEDSDAHVHHQVEAAARARGFDVVDLAAVFRQHPAPSLRIASDDYHPSVLAHRLAAETLAARIASAPQRYFATDGRRP